MENNEIEELTATVVAPTYAPAGFWRRLMASIVDTVVLQLILMPILWYLPLPEFPPQILLAQGDFAHYFRLAAVAIGITLLVNLGLKAIYFSWFYRNKGASPGKMLVQLKVLNSDTGLYLGYGRAFLREAFAKPFVSSILTLGFGYLLVGLRADKKGLHDLICSTQVVQAL